MPRLKKMTPEEVRAARALLDKKVIAGQLAFPEGIKEIRLALGMSQQAFADMVGLTRNQLVVYEAGNANPTINSLNKILKPFGFSVGFVKRSLP